MKKELKEVIRGYIDKNTDLENKVIQERLEKDGLKKQSMKYKDQVRALKQNL